MAITVNVQDLVNFPGNVKSMSLDQVSVVPQGYEGDEKYIMKFSTSAYSDIENRTAIPDYYVTDFKSGWVRSSGFSGDSGQFALTASVRGLLVKIDSTISGTTASGVGYYEIELDINDDGTPLGGEAIAEDLEVKIRALGSTFGAADIGFKAAYENASVEYKDGKFWIVSGTVSKFYTGNNKSSVDVIAGASNDAINELGFNLKTSSAVLATVSIKEALVTSGYTPTASGITIDRNIGASSGDCLVITDLTNTEYFQLNAPPTGNGTILNFSSTAITETYESNMAKVQLLKEQDPASGPLAWFDNFDKLARHGIKTIVNAMDFSE